ncbi:unnamed protein product, partial [Didymodactylos carnosus]
EGYEDFEGFAVLWYPYRTLICILYIVEGYEDFDGFAESTSYGDQMIGGAEKTAKFDVSLLAGTHT